MYRYLLVLSLAFTLLLAACNQATPAPAPTVVPTEAPAVAPTIAPTEAPTPTIAVEATATTTSAEVSATVTATTVATVTETVTETLTGTLTETGTVEVAATTGCVEPTDGAQLISSTEAGYCFLIPAAFERSPYSDTAGFRIGIYGPATTPGHRERAFVDVSEPTTQTLEMSVQAVVSDVLVALPGFTPTQTSLTLGGLPAIQLDNLPGQDINRKVFAVAESRVYTLTFVPFEAERADAQAEAEQLYALMLDSFRFITPTNAASSYAPFLSWEGEIDGACHTLTIDTEGEAAVGVCGDEPTATASLAENSEWAAIQEQFGGIDAETAAGKIVFQGQGSASSELWAQALAVWAGQKAMEINAGRVGAAVGTTLAWQLSDEPEHSGFCSQLVVRAYGYAYANQIPCEGSGETTPVAMGWLSDAELETFLNWATNGARVEDKAGYLDAQGSDSVTPEEITNWANAVYLRLLQ